MSVEAKITIGLKENVVALPFPVAVTFVVCDVTVILWALYVKMIS